MYKGMMLVAALWAVTTISCTVSTGGLETGPAVGFFENLQQQTTVVVTPRGHGSGFVIAGHKNLVMTCAHVVREFDEALIRDYRDRVYAATVVYTDETNDIAILRVSQPLGLTGLGFGTPELGATVYGCGTPFSTRLAGSISRGIVSGFPTGLMNPQNVQTDTSINPGNSGGPVVDESGRVIGMAASIFGGTSAGVNLLVPSWLLSEALDKYLGGS